MYKILIIEDDIAIAGEMEKHIKAWDYDVKCVTDFTNVLSDFADFNPQLVLLDIGLPFFNGYHWCSEIRKISKVPILFISSASDNMNIIMAMNMGADDFIAKPFDIDVLIAKIQALLRRTYDFGGQVNLIEHNGAILNTSSAEITYHGVTRTLTNNENKILQTLLESKGKIVSRDTLMTKLWQTDNYVDENTLTVNVTRLRRKLDELGLNNFITTKKGVGYLVELSRK